MAPEVPPADFRILVSTFATQAAVSLGQIENPITKRTSIDLTQAKFAIDLLDVVKQKTAGNLDAEEGAFLDDCLYQLRMLFIDKSAKKK